MSSKIVRYITIFERSDDLTPPLSEYILHGLRRRMAQKIIKSAPPSDSLNPRQLDYFKKYTKEDFPIDFDKYEYYYQEGYHSWYATKFQRALKRWKIRTYGLWESVLVLHVYENNNGEEGEYIGKIALRGVSPELFKEFYGKGNEFNFDEEDFITQKHVDFINKKIRFNNVDFSKYIYRPMIWEDLYKEEFNSDLIPPIVE